MKLYLIYTLFFLLYSSETVSQNTRISHYNNIGWYAYFGTFKLNDKWGIHTEYQWRRVNTISDWQQGLLRVGINYNINPRVLARVGYANAETYPYGEYTINGFGRNFSEHRFFQMLQLSHKEGIFDFSHRFMLEQRFVGKYSNANASTQDEFPMLNRMRYMARLQIPLAGKNIIDKTPYFAVYDEILIGFGKNVNANVFDQNRLGALFGYRFNKSVRIEAGYLNQIIQFGRLINGKNVFQYNNGFIMNANFNFDVSKKKKE